MSFTNEQIAKAKAAKSVEELLILAKENGIEMTEDQAKEYFAEWHKEGELSDDELANVSGGCGGPDRYIYTQYCTDPDDFEVLDNLVNWSLTCNYCKHFARENTGSGFGYCIK